MCLYCRSVCTDSVALRSQTDSGLSPFGIAFVVTCSTLVWSMRRDGFCQEGLGEREKIELVREDTNLYELYGVSTGGVPVNFVKVEMRMEKGSRSVLVQFFQVLESPLRQRERQGTLHCVRYSVFFQDVWLSVAHHTFFLHPAMVTACSDLLV